jgi:hypothetical protein
LEIAIEEVIVIRAEQKLRQASEVVLESLFIKRYAGKPEEIVFEVIEIPRNGLSIETRPRVANPVIQIPPCFDLELRQQSDGHSISFNHRFGDLSADSMTREKLEESCVSEIFLDVSAVLEVLSKNLGNRQAVPSKVFRKFDKRCIFFANVVKHPDGSDAVAEEANDVASGSTKLPLQRLRTFHRV